MKKEDEMIVDRRRRRELRDPSHIPLWLDDYTDIFSDFDPRPYQLKALSDDFLLELKKASRDKEEGKFELKIFVPENERDKKEENIISRRLHEHFKRHHQLLKKTTGDMIRKGFIFIGIGILFMIFATFFLVRATSNIFITFFSVVSEPAGWFLFWEGLNTVLFRSKEEHPDLEFYRKMASAEIRFLSY